MTVVGRDDRVRRRSVMRVVFLQSSIIGSVDRSVWLDEKWLAVD